MQAKPSHFRYLSKPITLFPGRDGLRREYLAALLWSDSNAVSDRAAQYLSHGVFVALFQVQVTVFFLAFQDTFSLQVSGNPVADRMHQHRQFLLVGGIGAMKSIFTPGRGGVDTNETWVSYSFTIPLIPFLGVLFLFFSYSSSFGRPIPLIPCWVGLAGSFQYNPLGNFTGICQATSPPSV